MKNTIYILLTITLFGCDSNKGKSFSELPSIRAYYEFDKQYKPKLPKERTFLKESIQKEIKSLHTGIENVKGIGTWTNLELDTTHLKHFHLSLLEGDINDTANYLLVTSCKITDTIIYSSMHNDYELELIGVYPHSSKNNKDGIRIEYIRDLSTEDSTLIQKAHFEIPEKTGIPEVRDVFIDSEQIFYALGEENSMSGRYEVKDDSIQVILEIRDQQLPETIPFRLITKSPKNCYSFTNRNYAEFRNNKFAPDSNITITIDSKTASIKFSKWANHCEEELSWQKEIVKVDNKVR